MIRRISSLALGMAVLLAAAGAFAQEGGGDDTGGAAAPSGGAAAPAGGAAAPAGGAATPAPSGGGAAASSDASASASMSASSSGGPVKSGLEIGLRVGYGLPLGDAVKGGSLSDGVSGQVPLILDIGYKINPNIVVGLYGQYGFAFYKPTCPSGISCSAHDLRFGVEGHYHFMPDAKFDPWAGIGIGYESLGVSASGSIAGISFDQSVTYSGFEFVNLQVGGDYKVSPAFGVGPFVTFSLAQFSNASSGGTSASISQTAMHEWLLLGVRGYYDIGF